MMKRLTLPAIAVAILIASTVWIAARSESARADNTSKAGTISTDSRAYLHSYNLLSSGIALEGYCPVAYFAVNKPVMGKPQHSSDHNGVTYHFVSADAKRAFDADPEKYVPAYGGWCAFGMAVEDKFPVDPQNFKIVDGKLLVFLKNKNVDALELWNDGAEQDNLRKASAHWHKVSG
jgi:YHS domain-containing protein